MWRCAICETNNDEQAVSCIVCGSMRTDSEKLAQEAASADDAAAQEMPVTAPEAAAEPEVDVYEAAPGGHEAYEDAGYNAPDMSAGDDARYDREAVYEGSYALGGTVVRHRRIWPFLAALAAMLVLAAASGMLITQRMYSFAEDSYAAGEYEAAQQRFSGIGWYRDSSARAAECKKLMHIEAGDALIAEGDFAGARAEYAMAGGDDGAKAITASWMYQSDALVLQGDFEGALEVLENVADTSVGLIEIGRVKAAHGRACLEAGDTDAAREAVADIAAGSDGGSVMFEAYMLDAAAALEARDADAAADALELAGEYALTDDQTVIFDGTAGAIAALEAELLAEEAARIAEEQAAAEAAAAEAARIEAEKKAAEEAEEALRLAEEEAARIEAEEKAAEEAALLAELELKALMEHADALAEAGDNCGAVAAYIRAGGERSVIAGLSMAESERIAAGDMHYVTVSNGTAEAYGNNFYGQCNVNGVNNVIQAAAGSFHSVLLLADGTVAAVGDNSYGQCDVSGWTDIVAVAAGSFHTVGLRDDGTVVAAGWDAYGQRGVRSWANITAIAAGERHTVGLRRDGTVVAVGDSSGGQCDVSEWTDVTGIDCGAEHTVGMRKNGTLIAAGADDNGACAVESAADVIAFAAGREHTAWLSIDGSVNGCGSDAYGQPAAADGLLAALAAGGAFTVFTDENGETALYGDIYGTIGENSGSGMIRMLQQALGLGGYYAGTVDGRWSDALAAAVSAASADIGAVYDGEASSALLEKLFGN